MFKVIEIELIKHAAEWEQTLAEHSSDEKFEAKVWEKQKLVERMRYYTRRQLCRRLEEERQKNKMQKILTKLKEQEDKEFKPKRIPMARSPPPEVKAKSPDEEYLCSKKNAMSETKYLGVSLAQLEHQGRTGKGIKWVKQDK